MVLSSVSFKAPCPMPDIASCDPDGGPGKYLSDVVAAAERGCRVGRRNYWTKQKIKDYQIVIRGTLGCSDMMREIMSYVSDQEFLSVFINYLMNFPELLNVETCLPIISKRKELVCNCKRDMDFLKECLQNIPQVNTGILIKMDCIQEHISMIEKFSTVKLSNMRISCKDFLGLINPSTSRIRHLRFTNFAFTDSIDSLPEHRTFRVSPHLKKFTFETDGTLGKFWISEKEEGENEEERSWEWLKKKKEQKEKPNPILYLYPKLDVENSNIEELVFLSPMSGSDQTLVSNLSSKLVRLSVLNQVIPKDWELDNAPLLNYLGISQLTSHPLTCQELYVNEATRSVRKPDNNVKRITFGKGGTNAWKVSQISFLGEWFSGLMLNYPNCEEIILSETFFDDLEEGDTLHDVISCSLKRIILKHSKHTQLSKYGSLKFMLQLFFPNAIVKLEELSTETCIDNYERFEILPSSNRILKIDCYEDILFRRIEDSEKHFKSMDNTLIKEKIREMKKIYCSCVISKKFEKLALVQDGLNILEGLKRNKQLMLETIHQAIENYNDIFTNDRLYMETIEKFDLCLQTLDGEYFSEISFSKRYSELEVLFHKMIQVVEEHNYPSKVLFNEQWFNDQIVEMYSNRVDERDLQFFEDSDEEMIEACIDIDSDLVLEEDYLSDFELVA